MARMVIDTLGSLKDEKLYDLFWDKVSVVAKSVDVEESVLLRQRKRAKHYDDGLSSGTFHESPKSYYCQLYYEAIDNIVSCLNDCFEQPGYRIYSNLEQLLVKACQKKEFEEEFQFLCSFYGDDLQPELLRAQLLTLGIDF